MKGKLILAPTTIINIEKNVYLEMYSAHIIGVDSTMRDSRPVLKDGATLVINEKL